jgi:hypothetical protein
MLPVTFRPIALAVGEIAQPIIADAAIKIAKEICKFTLDIINKGEISEASQNVHDNIGQAKRNIDKPWNRLKRI